MKVSLNVLKGFINQLMKESRGSTSSLEPPSKDSLVRVFDVHGRIGDDEIFMVGDVKPLRRGDGWFVTLHTIDGPSPATIRVSTEDVILRPCTNSGALIDE